MLWARERDVALGPEHVAIEVGDPLPSARGDVEIAERGLNAWGHAVPVELGIEIDEVRRRAIAELTVHARLLELVIERVRLAQIMRIAELADEVGGAEQGTLFLDLLVLRRDRNREASALDRTSNALGVEHVDRPEAIECKQDRAVDVMHQECRVRGSARQL